MQVRESNIHPFISCLVTRFTVGVHRHSFFPLGFLYLSPENNGNYALHDIYTSLHWIKNNIHHFNGDANRVTVYGTGTGAVLASLVVMMETVNGKNEI